MSCSPPPTLFTTYWAAITAEFTPSPPPPTPFDLIYRKKNAKCKPEGPKRRTREGGVNGSR
jgi:hypothetical protein